MLHTKKTSAFCFLLAVPCRVTSGYYFFMQYGANKQTFQAYCKCVTGLWGTGKWDGRRGWCMGLRYLHSLGEIQHTGFLFSGCGITAVELVLTCQSVALPRQTLLLFLPHFKRKLIFFEIKSRHCFIPDCRLSLCLISFRYIQSFLRERVTNISSTKFRIYNTLAFARSTTRVFVVYRGKE